jgi:dienelactone hydrolase
MRAAKTSLAMPRAVEKIIDSVPYLRELPWMEKKNVAVLGFCMGGGLTLYAVAQSRGFAGGVIYYQSLFPDPEDLKSISAPLCVTTGPMIPALRRRNRPLSPSPRQV